MRRVDGEHRPWPAPPGPWVLRMRWHDLCFLHWRLDPGLLERLMPSSLALDTFDGSAWLGVVPFLMSDVSLRGTPRVRRLADFGELNVRTYVTAGGRPGVWFFSLDASAPLAVRVARTICHLPYHDARITLQAEAANYHYTSERTEPAAPAAALDVRYRATAEPRRSEPGTLEHFLIERYCLYVTDRAGRLLRQEVDHVPWPVQAATATVERCTVAEPLGVALEGGPLAHFSASLDVVAWRQQEVT